MATKSATSGIRWIPGFTLAAVALLFVTLSVQRIWNADLWWQLGTGRWILEHLTVPRHDFLSYTAAGREWIELRWLFCVMSFAAWRLGGASLLILGQTVVLAAAFLVVVWPSRRVVTQLSGAGILALGVAAASDRFVVRPELISFLLLAVYLVVLEGHVRGRNRHLIWLLPVLQVLWVNSHTLFIFGPALAWAFAGGQLLQRFLPPRGAGKDRSGAAGRLLLLAAGITAACWINPYGHRGALFPLLLFREIQPGSVLGQSVQEFRSPWSMSGWPAFLWAAAALALISAFTFVLNRRRVDLTRCGIWLAFLYLSLLAVRNVSGFALVATWAALRNLEAVAAQRPAARSRRGLLPAASAAHLVLAGLLIFTAWYVASGRYAQRTGDVRRFGLGIVEERAPAAATDFIVRSGATPQLLNDLSDGSYLIWSAGERFRVFVDGRLEVYGEPLIAQYLWTTRHDWQDPEEWNRFAGRLGINTAMLNREYHGSLLKLLSRTPDWALVHLDPRNAVFVRDIPAHRSLIESQRIDLDRPWTPRGEDELPRGWRRWIGAVGRPWYSFGMAKLFLAVGSVDNAAASLERGLASFPDHVEMRWTLAQIYRSRGRDAEADRLLAGLRLPVHQGVRADRLLAQLLSLAGRPSEAIVALERASRSSEDVALLAELGEVCLRARDYRRATEAYRRAVALKPAMPSYWVNLGLAYQQLGEAGDAIEAYKRALSHDPSLVQVHNQLGILLARRGELAEAASCFEKALAIEPDYAPARANLDRLRGLM